MWTDLKSEVERFLNVKVFPLIGPQTEKEFVTIQLVSDPNIESGSIRTSLIAARYQLSFISPFYKRVEEMDKILWSAWKDIRHGHISAYPVQYVARGGLSESYTAEDGGVYRRARDFIFYCPEDAS
ncbi:hypothetical protein VRC35_06955 [Erwinia aphidicola]|uniref:hypothetical protein n=1 Tax=Erwinia aphidicola TaxID=68334 RepID=UPI0030D07BA9